MIFSIIRSNFFYGMKSHKLSSQIIGSPGEVHFVLIHTGISTK